MFFNDFIYLCNLFYFCWAFNDFIYLCNLFYFCWAFIAAQAFLQLQWAGLPSSCRMWASRCGGLSCSIGCCLGRTGFCSCGFQALEHRLSSCGSWASLLLGRWDLPGSGIELVSPALAGGSFTTKPPGKSPPPLQLFFTCEPWLRAWPMWWDV